MMLFSFMGGVSFPGVPAPVVRWLRTEGYTAFSSFTHLLTLPHRLLVLEYAEPHGPAAAGRHYGLSARTIRRWRKRWRQGGVEGLVPSYPRHRVRRVPPATIELIRQARQEFGYGAARTRLWLQRLHEVRLAMGTSIGNTSTLRRRSPPFLAPGPVT
jgi:transposase